MVQTLIPFEQTGAKRTGSHRGGLQQKYVLSDAQRRILLERYDGRTETLDELMRYFPGIPRWKVRYWASKMGLGRRKEPRWTPEEIEYLQRNLHKKSLGAIARHLGRTKTAVQVKAKRIGVNKTQQEGYTMRGLCLGLGCDHKHVERWLAKGWLKGTRRNTERETRDVWYFSDGQIRSFLKKHPEEIDPRRFDWLWVVDILVGGLGTLGGEVVEE